MRRLKRGQRHFGDLILHLRLLEKRRGAHILRRRGAHFMRV
jgi:predicted CopG family antitoxin